MKFKCELIKFQRIHLYYITLWVSIILVFIRDLPLNKNYAYGNLYPLGNNMDIILYGEFISAFWFSPMGSPSFWTTEHFYYAIISYLFGIYAQKILLFGSIFLAFISMYMFLSRFIDNENIRFLVATAYGLSPMMITRIIHGFLPEPILFGAQPLFWHKILDIFEKNNKLKPTLEFIIIYGLFGSIWTNVFWAIIPTAILVSCFFLIIKISDVKSWIYSNIYLVIGVLIGGLLLQLPGVGIILYMENTVQQSEEMLVKDVVRLYSQETLLNIFRLTGDGRSAMKILGYNGSEYWTYCGFIVALFLLITILNFRDIDKKKQKYVILLWVIYIVITSIIYFIHSGIILDILKRNPELFSLRNPARLMFIVNVAAYSLFGIGIETIYNRLPKKYNIKIAFLVILFVFIIIYAYPIHSGDFSLKYHYSRSGYNLEYGKNGNVVVPEYYYEISRILEDKGNKNPVLILPYSRFHQLSVRTIIPLHIGVRQEGSAVIFTPNREAVYNLFKVFEDKNISELGTILRIFGVKYIIVDKGYQSPINKIKVYKNRYNVPWVVGPPQAFIDYLENQKDIIKIIETENYIIYKNTEIVPNYIDVFDKLSLIMYKNDQNFIYNYLTFTKLVPDYNRYVIIFIKEEDNEQYKKLLFYANKIFLNNGSLITVKFNFNNKDDNKNRPYSGKCIQLLTNNTISTKYEFTISKNCLQGEYLYMWLGVNYHDDWRTYYDNTPIKSVKFKAFGWANGFIIDKSSIDCKKEEKCKISIYFVQQDTRNILISVFLITWLIIILSYLLIIYKNCKERSIT